MTPKEKNGILDTVNDKLPHVNADQNRPRRTGALPSHIRLNARDITQAYAKIAIGFIL